jgi:prepilin-type processing-associated H-X9-DG protein
MAPDVDKRTLFSYIDTYDLYKCPDDEKISAIHHNPGTVWSAWGTSYVRSEEVYINGTDNVFQIPQSSLTILLGDTTIYTCKKTDWPAHDGLYSWHSDDDWWSNILFFDNHVKFTLVDHQPYPEPGQDYIWDPDP